MAAPELPFFSAPAPALRHLPLPNAPRRIDAQGRSVPPPPPRNVDRLQKGAALAARIDEIEHEIGSEPVTFTGEPSGRTGIPLEIRTAFGHTISADDIHKLTTSSNIEVLLAVPEKSEDGLKRTRMLLHVPYGELGALREKFRKFGEESTPLGNTPNPWIANLEDIARAAIPGLWTDEEPLPSDSASHWWEFWLLAGSDNLEAFKFLAERFEVRLKPGILKLPERVVIIGSATLASLEAAVPLLDCLAELRRARATSLDWTDLNAADQQEIAADTADRLIVPADNAPSVCLLDTGVNRGHPLLAPLLAPDDTHTIFGDGDSSDCYPGDGHGTLSVGLAAYGDLREVLAHSDPILATHILESVRMFDGDRPHEPDNYGHVTRQAVGTAETIHGQRQRVFAMPVSSEGENDGRPSSWSAAVDALAFGSEEEGEPKRLVILSAGNTDYLNADVPLAYPDENLRCPVENPGQAWNALTVGAITHRTIRETDPESRLFREIAPLGSLSPHSRTSAPWDPHWPIKPEIVFEGGNLAVDNDQMAHRRDSLDLLSTSKRIHDRLIAPFRATSASTALAAKFAAEIHAEYPTFRSETVRGLMVHSARWSDAMLQGMDPHRPGTSKSVAKILRQYGYGEPDAVRARASAQNAVTLTREDSLRPFTNEGGLSDCHIHTLPIPANLLGDPHLGDAIMKVTLSYFIAPSPSASNRMPGSRYRYAGCLLRFEARNANETDEAFLRRVGNAAADEENGETDGVEDEGEAVASRTRLNHGRWALGPALRGKGGSLIHDVWRGSAADLLTMNQIAVFPKKGWWSYRSFPRDSPWHQCKRRQIPYSLIVSLETIADIPLYTEISNLLTIPLDA